MKQNDSKTVKKPFVIPELIIHGDVEVITLGKKTGDFTDRTFPIGTPLKNETFS